MYTGVSGEMVSGGERESFGGKMGIFMKALGRRENPVVMGALSIGMGMYMKAIF